MSADTVISRFTQVSDDELDCLLQNAILETKVANKYSINVITNYLLRKGRSIFDINVNNNKRIKQKELRKTIATLFFMNISMILLNN